MHIAGVVWGGGEREREGERRRRERERGRGILPKVKTVVYDEYYTCQYCLYYISCVGINNYSNTSVCCYTIARQQVYILIFLSC